MRGNQGKVSPRGMRERDLGSEFLPPPLLHCCWVEGSSHSHYSFSPININATRGPRSKFRGQTLQLGTIESNLQGVNNNGTYLKGTNR